VRRALPPLLAALALLALGCQESGFDEKKETEKPLKVQHALGETKVPGQAEQPMTLTVATLDDTLALGVQPARAAVPGAKLPAYLRSAGGDVSLMMPVTESDLAAVEAVHPDLILGSARSQAKLYGDLSRIAPTVMIDGSGSQWRLDLRLAGEGLGRTNDAERLLTEYDQQAFRARKAIRAGRGPSARKPRFAVALVTDSGIRYATRDSFAGTILADAGVEQVRNARDADLTLVARAPGARAPNASLPGRTATVSASLWFGSGGSIAASTALTELTNAGLGGR
jgi:iron-siderophore transport system substrate-binding protein